MSKDKAKVDWKNLTITVATITVGVVIGNYTFANIPRATDKVKSMFKGKPVETTTPAGAGE